MSISRKLCLLSSVYCMQITEASQNSELKFTHNTVNSLFTASRSPRTRQILFGPNCISNTNYTKLCIWNTKYKIHFVSNQNTKYMQCILNTYFKYLYFKYFTTLSTTKARVRVNHCLQTKCAVVLDKTVHIRRIPDITHHRYDQTISRDCKTHTLNP